MGRPATPMCPGPTPEELLAEGSLSYDDAAAFCGISRSEINKAVQRGELKPFHHRTKPLLPKLALIRWQAAMYRAEPPRGTHDERDGGAVRRPGDLCGGDPGRPRGG